MKSCSFSEEMLSAYLDGEAGARSRDVEQHLEGCAECRGMLESWRQSGGELVRLVDAGAGDVEPLVALSRIRARVAAAKLRSPAARLAAWWSDLWTLRRRAVAGVMVAAALGALAAPLLVLWAGRHGYGQSSNVVANVTIESMEWAGGTPVVYPGGGGETTLIWVEPHATPAGKPQREVQ
jgi:anti-sigma factor RsiW